MVIGYQSIDTQMLWHAARDYCVDSGGYLVTIQSASENTFVFDLLPSTWVSGTDTYTLIATYHDEVTTLAEDVQVDDIPSEGYELLVDEAPAFTSDDEQSFIISEESSFTIEVSGFPTPSISLDGELPNGVSFIDNIDGTASLFGTPGAGSEGTYALTLTATNGISPNAIQVFTLEIRNDYQSYLPLILK